MFFRTLDQIDTTIIEMLAQNARQSYVEIANAVGLSPVAVKNRINTMESNGIIEGYCIIVNSQKIAQSISMFIDLSVEPGTLQQVVDTLNRDSHITQIYLLTGDAKLHVHGIFDGNDDRAAFMREVLYTLPGIRSISSYDIVDRIKDVRSFRL